MEENGGEARMPEEESGTKPEETIETVVDGITVRGTIYHRTGSDICVRITSPYRGITGGLHIPYFGRQKFSYIGRYGDETALILLKRVYLLARHIDLNSESLVLKYRSVRAEVDSLPSKPVADMAGATRRELRARLRSGELDSREYQRQLARLRKSVSEHESQVYSITARFFTENFPMCVPVGTTDEVIAILEGRVTLHPVPDQAPPPG